MLWILWDILLPLVAAFLLGLLTGWLLWRWRRARISAQKLNVIQRNSARYKDENERLRDRLAESKGPPNDAAHAAPESSPRSLSRRQAVENEKEIATLREQLETAKNRIGELETKTTSTTDSGYEPEPEVADLMAQLQTRERMIETLQQSLAQYQEGDDPALMQAELVARQRKIDALETMLAAQMSRIQ